MVTINGVTYIGNSVVMSNNRIIIDGKDVETMSGDVDCIGNIAGKVKTMSGDVKYRK